MGKGRKGECVELRPASIRIRFTYQGKRCRETIPVPPTEANRRRASRLVAEIRRRIENGSFIYAEFFPDSAHAQEIVVDKFSVYGARWLAAQGTLSVATRDKYRLAIDFWNGREMEGGVRLGEKLVTSIRQTELEAIANAVPNSKHRNNLLTALRGAIAFARKDVPQLPDLLVDVKNGKVSKAKPDPLDMDEVEAILTDMREHYDEQVSNYFEFAFFSGLRPEEQIALLWSDADMRHRTVRVQRARTFKGSIKPPKTYVARDVDLNSRTEAVLKRQKKYTFIAGAEIFFNPVIGRGWHDERSQREHYWQPALKRMGIRMRRAYQTRHTYATMLLMAGANPSYVARQLGHANAQMLFTTYSKWIDGADRGREIAKLEDTLQGQFGPNLAPRKVK